MTIVVLIGHIGSGKSLAASILKSHGFIELTFAEPIKEFAKALHFTENEINGSQKEKLELNPLWCISGREFMQKFGTDVCRYLLPQKIPQLHSIFVQALEYKLLKNINANVVISDCRFLDELLMAKKYNITIIKLVRFRNYNKSSTLHISESSLDSHEADVTIYNDGTVEDLENSLINTLDLSIFNKKSLLISLLLIFGELFIISLLAEYFVK